MALYYTEVCTNGRFRYLQTNQEYAAAIDVSNLKNKKEEQDRVLLLQRCRKKLIRSTEYSDNTQFNNLETLIIQNNINIVYTYGSAEKGKLQHISKLLEQLKVELKIVKKRYLQFFSVIISDFGHADVEHDLSILIGESNLNLYPDILAKPLAMKAAGVLINVLLFSWLQTAT